jgi:hypothetical protein
LNSSQHPKSIKVADNNTMKSLGIVTLLSISLEGVVQLVDNVGLVEIRNIAEEQLIVPRDSLIAC